MSIPVVKQQIELQLTPQSSGDVVTSADLRDVLQQTADALHDMGTLQVATTDDFIKYGAVDGVFAYVDSTGFFKYLPEGSPDNVTSFPSSDSGIWIQQVAVSGGDSGGGGTVDTTGLVPDTRTINGVSLQDDITLDKSNFTDLNQVDNTPDDNKPVSIPQAEQFSILAGQIAALQTAFNTLQATVNSHTSQLAVKADLVAGKVPSAQLPSYVDGIVEVANFAALPVSGDASKIYVTLNDTKQYRWSGSVYVPLGGSGGGGATIVDTYFTSTDGQTVVPLSGSIGKYVFFVRNGDDTSWKIIHAGSGTLADNEVRHDPVGGSLTFGGGGLAATTNNLVLFF